MSCFIDMGILNNSYYHDFNVEIEDSNSLFPANPIVYQQRGRITIFKEALLARIFHTILCIRLSRVLHEYVSRK